MYCYKLFKQLLKNNNNVKKAKTANWTVQSILTITVPDIICPLFKLHLWVKRRTQFLGILSKKIYFTKKDLCLFLSSRARPVILYQMEVHKKSICWPAVESKWELIFSLHFSLSWHFHSFKVLLFQQKFIHNHRQV